MIKKYKGAIIAQKFIKDKAIQLKDLLLSIFNIVIEQSKDLSKEYLEFY